VSLYKRGKVYWSAIWIDGVRQMRSLETGNRRRAEELEQRWRDELHTQRFQLSNYKPEMPLAELWARFLAEGEVKAYHRDRAKLLLPFFAEMSIGQITKNDIARYRKQRHADYLKKQDSDGPQPLSETTVNRDVEVIRHLLFWAVDEGIIAANPIARIRTARERGKRRPVLTVADELKLLATCSKHLKPIVMAALDTGMRRGELLNQDWRDIDFDRKVLSVTHSKTAEGEHRLIPLTTRLYALLDGMRQTSGVIFTYEKQPIHRLKTGWAGALRRAGIPYLRFHDLRHTFNSRLADLGVIADIRKELMGHSRGGDVHSLYTHIELPTLREAINRLDAWHTEKVRALQSTGDGATAPHDINQTTGAGKEEDPGQPETGLQRKEPSDDRKEQSTTEAA
jgi:integrase